MKNKYKSFNISGMNIGVPINAFPPKRFNQLKRSGWKKYESDERKLIKNIPESANVLELGGCLGVISCLINKRLSNPSSHIVLEPNRSLIEVLQHNALNNKCSFQTFHGVLGNKNDKVLFAESPNNIVRSQLNSRRMHRKWKNYEVDSVTILQLETLFGVKFDTLVIDAEGAEFFIFDEVLFVDECVNKFQTLMVEFHKQYEKVIRIVEEMKKRGYKIKGNITEQAPDFNLIFYK